MEIATLITDLANRRAILINAYALLCSVLGCAALSGQFSSGLRPLAQIGTWADAVGWFSGARWFAGTATRAFVPGADVWTFVATVLLFCVALAIGNASSQREALESPASLTLWLSLATLAQAGAPWTACLAGWLALTLLLCLRQHLVDESGAGAGPVLARPLLALFLGIATAPLGALSALLTGTGPPSEAERARSITREVLLAKRKLERDDDA